MNPAPPSSDAEFLRRVSIDIIGRIPRPEEVHAFLEDLNPAKREAYVDKLLASPSFVDNWTHFFADHFEVTSNYYNVIGEVGRNKFYFYLRDFISRDRSYKDVATELITVSGDSQQNGLVNFLVRMWQNGDPVQDTYDALADRITTKFLGIKTQCVSCHNGSRHLESINYYLAARKRTEFWQMSSFLSQISLTQMPVDAFSRQQKFVVSDRKATGYSSSVNPSNPGPRPYRYGGPYTPAYMFTGEVPRNENWRDEFARILTSDRQFARATVNYVWAHFFTTGIVDPPDAWDLSRQDPANPPSGILGLQPSHPELMEALASDFIASNYSIKHLVRMIAQSSAYQLSSNYEGTWKPEYAVLFAKHQPRRMSAEEVYDSVITATRTETPMYIAGFPTPILYAMQLPDVSEPGNYYSPTPASYTSNNTIRSFLANFGRGDWNTVEHNSKSTVIQTLFTMNDNSMVFRTFATRDAPGATLISHLAQTAMPDDETVRQLFLATLSRYPTDDEMRISLTYKKPSRETWLSDLQWALLNKLDFIFNY